uniref:Uncharacterized protein n=1 Tax=Vitis vinifera TaxID=29760 RepID=F6HXF2_VITVI
MPEAITLRRISILGSKDNHSRCTGMYAQSSLHSSLQNRQRR